MRWHWTQLGNIYISDSNNYRWQRPRSGSFYRNHHHRGWHRHWKLLRRRRTGYQCKRPSAHGAGAGRGRQHLFRGLGKRTCPQFTASTRDITTVRAGNGSEGYSGDGGPATTPSSMTHMAWLWTRQAMCRCRNAGRADFFGNFASFVVGVARTRPLHDRVRDQALFQFPGKKAFAGVSGPERAVAIEGGQLRVEG